MNKKLTAISLLVIVTAADLYLGWQNSEWRLFTKPLLMPILLVYYYLETGFQGIFPRLMASALFFSWLGDVLLLFEASNGIFFILGLSAFLTAHLLYIVYFSRIRTDSASWFRKRPVMFIVVVAYVIELLYILWPNLGGMALPVVIYALVIGTMLCFALWQYGRLKDRISFTFIAGAILFVLSDSALALDKFHNHHAWSGLLVMSTYVAAQALLVMGSVAHLQEKA